LFETYKTAKTTQNFMYAVHAQPQQAAVPNGGLSDTTIVRCSAYHNAR